MADRLVSVVIPVHNEDRNIQPCLRALAAALAGLDHEVLVCYDFEGDTTPGAIEAMPDRPASARAVKNDLGRGPAWAIRAGLQAAAGDVIVVTMADLSDPPEAIRLMAERIRAGADVVAGSRYMPGGSQTGGPRLKAFLSRAAGLSLRLLAGLNTHDATNSFRAYSRRLLQTVTIESDRGFEIGLELTVKAHRMGLRIEEVPTAWRDRSAGRSRFRILQWLPAYLRWYLRGLVGRRRR